MLIFCRKTKFWATRITTCFTSLLVITGVAFGAEEFQVTFLVKIIVVSLLKLQRCVFLFIAIVIVLYRRLITPVASLNNGWPTLRCPWVRSELHRKMILFHWDYSNRGWDQNHVVTVAFSEFMFSCNWCINPKFSVSPYLTSWQRQLLRSLRECQRLVYIEPLLQSKWQWHHRCFSRHHLPWL